MLDLSGECTDANGQRFSLEGLETIQMSDETVYDQSEDANGSARTHAYSSFEINLLFEGGRHAHLVDHASIKKIREDPDRLAAFLGGVPVNTRVADPLTFDDLPYYVKQRDE